MASWGTVNCSEVAAVQPAGKGPRETAAAEVSWAVGQGSWQVRGGGFIYNHRSFDMGGRALGS